MYAVNLMLGFVELSPTYARPDSGANDDFALKCANYSLRNNPVLVATAKPKPNTR